MLICLPSGVRVMGRPRLKLRSRLRLGVRVRVGVEYWIRAKLCAGYKVRATIIPYIHLSRSGKGHDHKYNPNPECTTNTPNGPNAVTNMR